MKKIIALLAIALLLSGCNIQIIDTTFYYNYAIIQLPNGEIVEGNVESWRDYEDGEFNDMIKKWIFHEKEIDVEHAKKELGDIWWYIALICNSFGWNMDEIAEMNDAKLKKRYKEGFTIEEANNRSSDDV